MTREEGLLEEDQMAWLASKASYVTRDGPEIQIFSEGWRANEERRKAAMEMAVMYRKRAIDAENRLRGFRPVNASMQIHADDPETCTVMVTLETDCGVDDGLAVLKKLGRAPI